MNFILILILIFFSLLLIKSADLVVVSLKKISRRTKTGVFALSAIILALGTSLPELFVSLTSAFEGVSNLSLGVVMGSNIVNTSLIVGTASLLIGAVHVQGAFLKRDVGIALIAGIAPLILILDGNLSQVDGLVLLTVYAIYASSLFKNRFAQIAHEEPEPDFFYRFFRKLTHIESKETRDYARLFIGITLLIVSADIIVKISKYLATSVGIPVFIVGLLILALGTSLPELAFSLRSLKDHAPGMFFGNLLGSTIVNSTLVIGIAALLNPIKVVAIYQYFIASAAFAIIFLTFWFFIRTKHRLDRWEAALLIVMYVIFVILEFT
jgi:cation:H+ antiporter